MNSEDKNCNNINNDLYYKNYKILQKLQYMIASHVNIKPITKPEAAMDAIISR